VKRESRVGLGAAALLDNVLSSLLEAG